jgi:pyruvate dehydrogenase E2 component (dihydrolipoyllysine-residue acetyltransferase)
MPFEFTLPQLSSEAEEGIVVAWFKREGAEVKEGENLLEVQLAKVSYDIPAPVAGRLYRILTPREAVIRQGQVLALILKPGEAAPAEQPATPAQAAPAGASAQAQPPSPPREVRASPIARRLAQEYGIDLATVRASSPDGRIAEADVRAVIAARAATSAIKTEPLSPMRKTIARRMTASLQTMAQLTLTSEADVTALVALREKLKPQYDVSYTDLIVKAVALALGAHPRLNARLVGDELQLLSAVNVGLAVAVDEGLIVPVIREVNKKSVREIASETKTLAERARAGKLTEAEMSGGTFSVTNLGMYEIDAFTPIINPPQVAILGVGRIVEKAARRDGELQWRQMLTLSLTFDHRAVDGAPAAAFLQTVRDQLEIPTDLVETSD